jgi:hypothetical protein
VIAAAIRGSDPSIAAQPIFQPGNSKANDNARRHRFHDASPKSVAMIRRDRDINLTIDNLIHHGNNRSAAELISSAPAHPANNL